jgi:predicted ATPase
MALILNRFHGEGIYILDEPEAALSPSRQMALLCRIHELVKQGSQFIIATHSPILMAYPDADIYLADHDKKITLTRYQDTEHYQLTREFINYPERMLSYLFEE